VQLLRTRGESFDGVLMDVQMPVMDGLAAMRLIRNELHLVDLPLIAFTAGVRDDQQAAARQAGANDVLPKPMDLDQMAVVLARWIRKRGQSSAPVAVPAQAAAAAADAGGSIPDLPGIDRARVQQRLGKDPTMFLGLLQLFIEDNADAVAQTRADLGRGDRESAARRMHTLRSNAGFICAQGMMEAAGELEGSIEQGAPGFELRLDDLARQIEALIEASRMTW